MKEGKGDWCHVFRSQTSLVSRFSFYNTVELNSANGMAAWTASSRI
jgi:hypothetical protein